MTQHVTLNAGSRAIEPFFDGVQEQLGASAPSFYFIALNSTTLRAPAGVDNDQSSVAIQGRYRWNTVTVDAIHPGGVAGTYDVWVTASDNSWVGDPTVDSTVYSYGFTIRATASPPATALKRKVGECDWDGAAITAVRQFVGQYRDGAPSDHLAPHAAHTPLRVRGAASQTAPLAVFRNSAGTTLLTISPTGLLSSTAEISTSHVDGFTATGAGGKDTLLLSSTGADTGITLGGDVTLYRPAADVLKTDDTFQSVLDVVARQGTAAAVTIGDQGPALQAGISLGLTNDTTFYRDVAGTWRTPGSVVIDGSLTVGGGTIIGVGSTAGGDISGIFSNLQIIANAVGTTEIANDAVDSTKLRDDAVTDANRAVTTNHIRDLAVTGAKIANNTILAAQIGPNAISANELATNAVGSDELANASVDTAAIVDLNVTTIKLADGAVTNAKLATNAVFAANINVGAVTTGKIPADTITALEIAPVTITAAEIVANTITANKIAPDAIGASELALNAVGTSELQDNAVDAAAIQSDAVITIKILDDAVTSAKLADHATTDASRAVTTNHIRDLNVTTAKINDGAVTNVKLGPNAVGTGKVIADTITALEIAPNTITAAEINADAITQNELGADSVGSSELIDGVITVAHLATTLIEQLVPVGTIRASGRSVADNGWLLCNGQAVSRTGANTALFSAIGTAYGVGDGSSTFNLPDLRGAVPFGLNSADTSFDSRSDSGGAKTVALTAAESGLRAHAHTGSSVEVQIWNEGFNTRLGIGQYGAWGWDSWTVVHAGQGPTQWMNAAGAALNINNSSSLTGTAHENLPPYIVVTYQIKL